MCRPSAPNDGHMKQTKNEIARPRAHATDKNVQFAFVVHTHYFHFYFAADLNCDRFVASGRIASTCSASILHFLFSALWPSRCALSLRDNWFRSIFTRGVSAVILCPLAGVCVLVNGHEIDNGTACSPFASTRLTDDRLNGPISSQTFCMISLPHVTLASTME